ncbi:MAG: SCO family protein [Saprospiraceae bacterium]
MMRIRIIGIIAVIGFFVVACESKSSDKPLPIIGRLEIVDGDTIHHTIPDFEFINQDSQLVTNQELTEYIYISDFFFTSCPSICPIVKKQMLRIYDKYKSNSMVKLVSHTIDPKRDTADKLKRYAADLGVDTDKWVFLTGDKESLLDIADAYFVAAYEDPDAPGGFDHSGKIILVDTKRQVRSFAEGTDPEDVDRFLKDIDKLLHEYDSKS